MIHDSEIIDLTYMQYVRSLYHYGRAIILLISAIQYKLLSKRIPNYFKRLSIRKFIRKLKHSRVGTALTIVYVNETYNIFRDLHISAISPAIYTLKQVCLCIFLLYTINTYFEIGWLRF